MRSSTPLLACLIASLLVSVTTPVLGDEALDVSRKKWEAANVSSYEFRYQKVCECHREMPSDTIVTVEQGEIVGVRFDREDFLDEVPVPPEKYEWFRTIDNLFALVAGALEREAVVRVSYEPELGYPTRIYIDYVQDMVGEEVELHVLELRESN